MIPLWLVLAALAQQPPQEAPPSPAGSPAPAVEEAVEQQDTAPPPAEAPAPAPQQEAPPAPAPQQEAPPAPAPQQEAPPAPAPQQEAPSAEGSAEEPSPWNEPVPQRPRTRAPFTGPLLEWVEVPAPRGGTETVPRWTFPTLPGDSGDLDELAQYLPRLPMRGAANAILLLLLTLACLAGDRAVGRWRDRVLPGGLLGRAAGIARATLRILAAFFGLGVVAAIVPASIAPALPIVVLAGAAAVGWTARDILPDLMAGLVLALERPVKPGQWIAVDGQAGVVETLGPRAIVVCDPAGRRTAIPNRAVLRRPLTSDPSRWPAVEVAFRVPPGQRPPQVRRWVEEAVLLSPWVAPDHAPDLLRDPEEPTRWRVRARLLEGRYAERFERALQDRMEEVVQRWEGAETEE